MAAHTPVIASTSTTLPEILGEAAYFFNPKSSESMTEAIQKVLSSPKLQKELIEKGKKQIQKYSWRKAAQETLAVYKSFERIKS